MPQPFVSASDSASLQSTPASQLGSPANCRLETPPAELVVNEAALFGVTAAVVAGAGAAGLAH